MWTASATPDTESTRYRSAQSYFLDGRAYLGGPWEHGFGCVQTSTGGFLDLLDLGSAFTDPTRQLLHNDVNLQAYTLPMRELGMINLMVTARDPGTEATS
jgi:hypothetical protein